MSTINKNQPIIRNKASIITTNISIRVYWKNQLDDAIKWLIEKEYPFSWEIIVGDSIVLTEYWLHVDNISFASNLKELTKILTTCDYKYEE